MLLRTLLHKLRGLGTNVVLMNESRAPMLPPAISREQFADVKAEVTRPYARLVSANNANVTRNYGRGDVDVTRPQISAYASKDVAPLTAAEIEALSGTVLIRERTAQMEHDRFRELDPQHHVWAEARRQHLLQRHYAEGAETLARMRAAEPPSPQRSLLLTPMDPDEPPNPQQELDL